MEDSGEAVRPVARYPPRIGPRHCLPYLGNIQRILWLACDSPPVEWGKRFFHNGLSFGFRGAWQDSQIKAIHQMGNEGTVSSTFAQCCFRRGSLFVFSRLARSSRTLSGSCMAVPYFANIEDFFSSPSSESMGVRFSLGTRLFPMPFVPLFFSMAFSMAPGWTNA